MPDLDPIVVALVVYAFRTAPEQLTGMRRLDYLAASKNELVMQASVLRSLAQQVDSESSLGAVQARAAAADAAAARAASAPPPPHITRIVSANRIAGFEQRVRSARQQYQSAQASADATLAAVEGEQPGSEFYRNIEAASAGATRAPWPRRTCSTRRREARRSARRPGEPQRGWRSRDPAAAGGVTHDGLGRRQVPRRGGDRNGLTTEPCAPALRPTQGEDRKVEALGLCTPTAQSRSRSW